MNNDNVLADFKKMLNMTGLKGRERLHLIRGLKEILNSQKESEVSLTPMRKWMVNNLVYINGKNYINWELAKRFLNLQENGVKISKDESDRQPYGVINPPEWDAEVVVSGDEKIPDGEPLVDGPEGITIKWIPSKLGGLFISCEHGDFWLDSKAEQFNFQPSENGLITDKLNGDTSFDREEGVESGDLCDFNVREDESDNKKILTDRVKRILDTYVMTNEIDHHIVDYITILLVDALLGLHESWDAEVEAPCDGKDADGEYKRFNVVHKSDGTTKLYIDGILYKDIEAGVPWGVQHWIIDYGIDPIGYADQSSEPPKES